VLHSWGDFNRYLEIGDDLYAVRQVDVFSNGNCLRYDRSRWEDEFNMLAGMKYNDEIWAKSWGPDTKITKDEFEKAWQLAQLAPNLAEQMASSPNTLPEPWIDPRRPSSK
jgi:hypothetical protein